jgi:hypothetical protein
MLAEGHRSFLVVLIVGTVNGLYEETFLFDLMGLASQATDCRGASIRPASEARRDSGCS